MSAFLRSMWGFKTQVFLVQVEYEESGELFRRFNVNSLPFIVRLSPTTAVGKDGNIKLKHDDVMRHEHYGHEIWSADDMASFLRDKTGLDVGKVRLPLPINSVCFPCRRPLHVPLFLRGGVLRGRGGGRGERERRRGGMEGALVRVEVSADVAGRTCR